MRPCAHQRPAADAGQRQARFCLITPGRSFGFRRRRVFQGRWASGGGRALFSLRPFAPSVSVSPPSCDGRGVRAPRGARGLGARQTGLPRRRDTKPGGRKAFTRGRREASSGSGILSGERLSLGTLARLPLKPPSSGRKEGLCGPKGGFSGAKGVSTKGRKEEGKAFIDRGYSLNKRKPFA